MAGDDTYLSPDAVAELLGVNRKTVYDAIHAGRLPALRLGRTFRVSRSDLDTYLRYEPPPHSTRTQSLRRSGRRGDFAQLVRGAG